MVKLNKQRTVINTIEAYASTRGTQFVIAVVVLVRHRMCRTMFNYR